MIKFTIITLFREAIEPYLRASMMWKATEKGLAEFDFVNLREFGLGPHKSVDDTPYGGGDGMLLRCEPVFAAIESVKAHDPSAKVILPTPVGEVWTQNTARAMAGVAEPIFPDARLDFSSTSYAGQPAEPSLRDEPVDLKSSAGRRLDTERKRSVYSAPTSVGSVRNIRVEKSNHVMLQKKKFSVRLRHRAPLIPATFDGETLHFENEIKRPASGQSAVLYDDEVCLGGGIIA